MKRLLSIVLCLSMLALMLTGCGKEKEVKKVNNSTVLKDGQVSTIEDLEKMTEFTNKDFALVNDIDFKGAEWKGFDKFEGTLNGNIAGDRNYTIKNFVIKPSKDDHLAGFVKELTGTIESVDFENVKIELPDGFTGDVGVVAGDSSLDTKNIHVLNAKITGKDFSGNLGSVVGFTDGDISNVFASGKISVSSSGESNIGAVAGIANDAQKLDVESDLDITVTKGKANVGGLVADILTMSDNVFDGTIKCKAEKKAKANVGVLAGVSEDSIVKCYSCATSFKVSGSSVKSSDYVAKAKVEPSECVKRDLSNLDSKTLSKEQYKLRKKVVDYVVELLTIKWSPKRDISFTNEKRNGDIEYFYQGQWYYGIPFTYQGSSLECMKNYLDKDGVMTDEIPETGWENMIGGTLAQCVLWGYSQVTDAVTFNTTTQMVLKNGMVNPGTYYSDESMKKTTEISAANDQQAIFEAYAHTNLGDTIVKEPGGHAYFLTEAPHVFRNPDGTIDSSKSYFIYDTQEAEIATIDSRHSLAVHHGKCTFDYAYSYSYMPFTVEVFKTCDEKPAETVSATVPENASLSVPDGWSVTSNYKINDVTIVVKDNGKEVFTKKGYPVHNAFSFTANPLDVLNDAQKSKLEDGKQYEMTIYVNGKDKAHKAATVTVTK